MIRMFGLMTDTIAIHQTLLLPTPKGVKSTPLNVDGYAVVNSDSLHNVMSNITDSLSCQQHTLEVMAAKVNEISENGAGYNDSIGIIAIPLLIALLAFAFPFLYNAMVRVNDKYASKQITGMFESTMAFRHLEKFSWIVVSVLILIGFSTLFKYHGLPYVPTAIINWLGVICSSIYAVIAIVIINQCFEYNKPPRVLQLICNKYVKEKKAQTRRKSFYQHLWKVLRLAFWKDAKWKEQKKKEMYYKLSIYDEVIETRHNERLAELAQYAIKEKNEQLLWEILTIVDGITQDEKKEWKETFIKNGTVGYAEPIYKTRSFYQSLARYYARSEPDKQIEERIIWRWLGAFSKALIPVDQEIGFVVAAVIHATETGHLAFFERYVDQSARSFKFIPHLSDIAFIRTGNVNCQHNTWKEVRKLWMDIRELHYLMAAYLFSKRNYGIIKSLLADRSISFERLYPIEATEVLLLFVKCKALNYGRSDFGVWRGDDLFGTDPEKDMLEKYTATMLLLCPSPTESAFASGKELDEINKFRPALLSYANWLKSNSELSILYPQIKEANFDNIYDSCIRIFDETKKLGYIEDTNHKVCLGWWQKCKLFIGDLLKCDKEKGSRSNIPDIFSAKVDKTHLEAFIYQIRCVFYNKKWMYCEQIEPDLTNMQRLDTLGTYSTLINKGYVNSFNIDEDGSYLFHIVNKLFEERSCYLMCAVFQKMEQHPLIVNYKSLETAVGQILGKEADKYMVIDFDSHSYMHMRVDYDGKKCLGADYMKVHLEMNDHLSDIDIVRDFLGSLLIVKKEDMPILAEDKYGDDAEIAIEDVSNKEEGLAAVRVDITPRYTMWYRNAKCYKVVIERK